MTIATCPSLANLTVDSTCPSSDSPPTGWSTFGRADFMRVPLPAASTIVSKDIGFIAVPEIEGQAAGQRADRPQGAPLRPCAALEHMSRSDGTNGYAFPQQRTSLAPSFVDRLLRLGEPCGSAGCSARRGHEGHRLQPVRHIEATMQAPQMPADLPPPLPPLQPRDLPSAGLFVRLYVTGWFLLSGLGVC